ncbi:MAG TPA: ATP-binding protein [Thermoanaerobaculia bacterium]|nr:ATP-binding protein [Thermoanaerobaculia bacterium]
MPDDTRDLFGGPSDAPRQAGAGERSSRRKPSRRRRVDRDVVQGKLKVHDPFELIRWLALSQPDPRKALAELVQNSLDAGARHVRVTRVRERGLPTLRIRDDGEGVIPELGRTEALRYIATHIGHSRKRSLSPSERLELMTQGQYGIGLLGFWSLGETLEMRTALPGQKPHRLVLFRERPDFRIEPLRARGLFDESFTEVVVGGLHKEAMSALVARRAADYLAAELRGQLLARAVELVLEDRMSRGRAEKLVAVRPPRFLGERLADLDRLDVAGHPPARLEIYLTVDEDETRTASPLALYAAGTLVATSFADLEALGLDRDPWTDARLTGLVDFPALAVAPGSRRGVVPDAAAGALVDALREVEPRLREALRRQQERQAEELDQRVLRDLQRAFRGFYRQQSRYTLLPVQSEAGKEAGGGSGAGEGPATGEGAEGPNVGAAVPPPGAEGLEAEALEAGLEEPPAAPEVAPALPFPPGPLAEVRLLPASVRLLCGTARRLRAEAVDEDGRRVAEEVEYRWRLIGDVVALEVEGAPADAPPDVAHGGADDPLRREGADGPARPAASHGPSSPATVIVRAGDSPGRATLTVVAMAGGRVASASAPIEVASEPGRGRSDEGIPEPELVDHPGAAWRSRIVEQRWQVNTAHPDYRAIKAQPALKTRYLALLFAKEVVLRSTQDPRLDKPLEQLAEIAAYADRNLAKGGRRKRKSGSSE